MVERIPVIGRTIARWSLALRRHWSTGSFSNSSEYWDQRYGAGGDSGRGSYGRSAAYKAEVLNRFVTEHQVRSVIEFGCGDGNQLGLARYPRYLGLDVSENAVLMCRERFAGDSSKRFALMADYDGETAELALSLDVIFHLVEDNVFDTHMQMLFAAADRFVIVFSTNVDDRRPLDRPHVRHRRFTDWVDQHAPLWTVRDGLAPANRARARRTAEFHVYARR